MPPKNEKPATAEIAVSGLLDSVGSGGLNDPEVSDFQSRKQDRPTRNWLLARARSAYSGAELVKQAIGQLGKDLAAGRIDNEQAAWDLNAIEETPLLYLSSLLTPACSEAA